MWVSLLLCLGTCIGLAWYDSPSNTATMPAGEIGAVSGVGSRPDVEGWSGFESALLDINQIRVGMRVAAENPEVSDAERRTFVDPDSATWRFLKLRLPKRADPRDFVEIEMLRPADWVRQQLAVVGGRVFLDLDELGTTSWAEVLTIDPCPEIVAGPGHVVTATFVHQPSSEILDVTITGSDGREETIGVTPIHPFWSVDHQAFVAVGQLSPGSRIKTHLDQIQTITNLLPRPGPAEPVFNLEVHGEHVYYVGTDGVLVHNSNANGMCPPKNRRYTTDDYRKMGISTSSQKTNPSIGYVIYNRDGSVHKFGVSDAAGKRLAKSMKEAPEGATYKYTSEMEKREAHLWEKYMVTLHHNSTAIRLPPGMKYPHPVE
jgi:hypothetical protein